MIDTHVHHWDLRRFQYPWLDDPAFDELRNDCLPADYRADDAGVDVEGWVHIRAEVDHQLDPVGETAWVATLAEEATAAGLPGPAACVVYADLRTADVREVLARRLAGDFGSLYELVVASLHDLSDQQRAEVLAGTARRFYRIPI